MSRNLFSRILSVWFLLAPTLKASTSATSQEGYHTGAEMDERDTFRMLLGEKRVHQLAAVKRLGKMAPDDRKEVLQSMLRKISQVLSEHRPKVVASLSGEEQLAGDFLGRISSQDRTSFALVVENACFAGDMVKQFPDLVRSWLRLTEGERQGWDYKETFGWAMGFLLDMVLPGNPDLIDGHSVKILQNSAEFLRNHTDDQGLGDNPQKSAPKKLGFADPPPISSKKKKARPKIERGPKLTRIEL